MPDHPPRSRRTQIFDDVVLGFSHDDRGVAPVGSHASMAAPLSRRWPATASHTGLFTALGPDPLDVPHSPGPGWRIVTGLTNSSGLTTDDCGLWACWRRAGDLAPEDHHRIALLMVAIWQRRLGLKSGWPLGQPGTPDP